MSFSMGTRKRRNVGRDRERREAFLRTKCLICYTPGEKPSKRLPCCGPQIHELCLLKCFQHDTRVTPRCPHCRSDIYPHNGGDPLPVHVPEGSVVFHFEFENFAPRSPEAIADELWDQMPVLEPPVGWSRYRRAHVGQI